MDGVQYQSERLQHALSQLDPHRMLNQEDAAQLQIALANATAIARRVVERQSCHAKPMTEPRSTYACAAGSSSSPLPLFAESIASVASQHGIPTAELRQHNPQLASYGDRELLPPNTFIKLRLRVETPRRAGTPGEYAALNTPDPLAPTPQGLHDGRAKGAPSDGSARSPGESPPRGLVLPSPSPSSLRGGVPASLLNVGRVGRPPTTTPATNPTPTPVTTVPVTIVPTTATAVPAAAPLMGRTRAAVDVPQDRSLMTNESSSFHSTPTPTPFSSPPAKNVAERFPMEEDPRRKGSYPVEAPLPVIPHASGPRRVTEDYRHIARTSPKPASAMDAENDYDNYDTLNSIAAQYGVLTNELLEWNPYLAAYKVDDPLPANLPIVLQKHHICLSASHTLLTAATDHKKQGPVSEFTHTHLYFWSNPIMVMKAPASSVASLSLPVVLRKDDSLVLSHFSEKNRTLTEVDASRYSGDYRECEICFNPNRATAFAHATTTHVRYSEVTPVTGDGGGLSSLKLLFEVEEKNVVAMSFSPKGTILVTYALMDSKRPEGNMAMYDVANGTLLRRCMQARWPGVMWTSQEEFAVRLVQGSLHVMEGDFRKGEQPALSKLELQLSQDKEVEFSTSPSGIPFLAVFKPFHKQNQGTVLVYRLPNIRDGPLFQVQFGRAESASMQWSPSGDYIVLFVKTESDKSGKSYYGTVKPFLLDIRGRAFKEIKFPSGESVHDCQWNPHTDEFMIVHGTMPRNKTTLYDKHGVALMTFGEAPRNLILWAPNGRFCALGGTGNLAGDFTFFDLQPQEGTKPVSVTPSGKPLAFSTGELNEKSSVQTWAPDSHIFMCATVFTRLRIDNKLVFFKNNGERLLTQKYPILYGAHFVRTQDTSLYPVRSASPRRESDAPAKPQAYRPPGGTSAAAAMLRRPDASAPKQAKPAGPVGATVVVQTKKKKR